MEFRRVLVLRGPNVWARYPVLEAWVDLGDLKDSPSDEMPGFNDRLMSWLPTMIEHRCSVGERGGFFERLRRGTYLAHILEHVTLELQTLAGTSVGFGKARETSEEGVYKVVVRYADEDLGRACLYAARDLCLAAVFDRPYDIEAEVCKLRQFADRVCLGPSTAAIVEAARTRGIPTRRLNAGSLVQLGFGARQRRIWTAETDRTGAIAESIAQDKQLTKTLLKAAGVPVPEGRQVESADDAWAAACEVGLPVVVKPLDANHGRGVIFDVTSREQIEAAYELALHEGSGVLVEKLAPGVEHRLLVVGNRMVAAASGELVFVTGDGRRTIAALVEDQINSDPRRGDDEALPLDRVIFDSSVISEIRRQGFEPSSIPPEARQVLITRKGNLTADVTDAVHPEVAARAVSAAHVVGLDVAGIDVVAQDISRPLEEQGGVVVEVNAGPGLLMHLKPSSGSPRPVGEAIVATLFPDGATGRIPIVAVTGTNGKTIVTRMTAHVLRLAGYEVGMTCSDGIYVNGRRIERGDCSGPRSARSVLLNPQVEAAVFEVARGGILREGLGFDRCDVAVVTNVGEADHLGLCYIDDAEKMAWVKQTPVDVVATDGAAVLNADDPLVAGMAPASRGSVIFFGRSHQNPVITDHCRQNGRAVFVRDGRLILAEGATETALVALANLPATHAGRVPFQEMNILAATAAAWALNIPATTLRAGLESFAADAAQLPGRFTLWPWPGSLVIVDDCHNASALRALMESLENFPQARRSIVYSASGDRRDADIIRQGELLGHGFDRIVLYEPATLCGRGPGEVPALLRQGLIGGCRVTEIVDCDGPLEAVEAGLALVEPGQLLVIQPSDIEETLNFLQNFHSPTSSRSERVL